VFTVTLHDVKEYELPPIDDAFAKSLSGKETLAELRSDVRQRLETIAESRGRRIIGSAIMDALLAAHDIALPSTMVEGEIDQLVNEAASMAARSGGTLEDYLTSVNKTEEELRADYRADAEARVKGTLLIEQIAKAENITATPSDLANELAALSRQYGQPLEQIQKALGSNVYSLMDGIVRTKTLDFLIDNAELTAAPPQPIIVTT
jgi:trigger factor